MSLPPIRRIVTGHDADGRAVITQDGPPPQVLRDFGGQSGLAFTEIWSTEAAPAPVGDGADPTLRPLQLAPPASGTLVRFVDIPPEPEGGMVLTQSEREALFGAIGGADAHVAGAAHATMHRTETIDYGILVAGELFLVVDDGEVALRPGDVVVQRGTAHAWSNRSGAMARMMFVLVDGRFDPELPHEHGSGA
jgi:hypothetical protein